MALPKLYDRVYWDNNTTPAINEDNLNSLSKAVDDIDDRVISLAGTIMEDVPQIQEDLEILEPAIENIDSNVERAETAADDAEDSAETAEYWANVSNPPIPVVKDFASVISVDDAIPKAATDVKVKIEAVQDLHGYTKPWVGGAGKNLLRIYPNYSVEQNGITVTGIKDSAGNQIGLNVNGRATADCALTIFGKGIGDSFAPLAGKTLKIYGGANSNSNVYMQCASSNGFWGNDTTGSGSSAFTVESTEPSNWNAQLIVKNGTQLNNVKIYPMICLASASSDFEPYENICPISGFTEAKLTRTGKNVFPIKLSEMKSRYATGWSGDALTRNGVTYNFIANGDYITEIRTSGTATGSGGSDIFIIDGIPTFLKDNVNYILTGCPAGGSDSTYLVQYNNWTEGATYLKYDYGEGFTFQKITDSTTQKMRIWIKNGANADGLVFKPMIRLATETDATFAPYTGTDYIIDLDGTRYGATLDVDSGVMVVDKAYKDLGTLAWTAITTRVTGKSRFRTPDLVSIIKPAPQNNVIANIITSDFKAITAENTYMLYDGDGIGVDTSGAIFIYDSTRDTLTGEQFTTAMSGVQLVYELATPITVQLTPTEVQMLQGYNVLSANSGDVYLKYDASMIQRIANEKLDISTFKSVVASSSDFADFKTRVAAL